MAISSARAKTLCNASELGLVKSSTRRESGMMTIEQLRKALARARKLRDKWRDQAAKQRRSSQRKQGARATDANARSKEKAELFGEVVNRFTAQLEKIETAENEANTSARRRKASSGATAATKIAVSRKSATAGGNKEAATKKPKSATSQVPVDGEATPIQAGRKAQGLQVTKTGQLRAAANATKSRVKASGAKRIHKHISARDKRNQAKRDSR